ncbi:hypothetical protein CR970_01320 [Candidatus Saccharibacteria bacterium]|nr:MAG: hypothetical protein CR970_01320 [Candidatus Saccharibacteria bacterium]
MMVAAAVVAVSAMFTVAPAPTVAAEEETTYKTHIYFFWGDGCPHCAKAKPFLEDLAASSDDIELYKFEVYHDTANQDLLQRVSERLGVDSSGIPFTIIGDKPFIGYSGAFAKPMRERVEYCVANGCPETVGEVAGIEGGNTPVLREGRSDPDDDQHQPAPSEPQTEERDQAHASDLEPAHDDDAKIINLPFVGAVNARDFSLPLLAIVIGALDGFNPCAMWVLIFLITVLLGMKDRRRMWLLGGSFIVASAAVYFLFMTAWLNIFSFIRYVAWIKAVIGVGAVAIGVYYLRDYFVNKQGSCKVTGDEQRQKMFARIRRVTHERNFWLALAGIVAVAFAVNLVELVCSAGLPAVFTGVLATSGIPVWQQYAYMLLYILVFMADDLLIFFTAMFTMRVTGLQSKYSRLSHLVGGIIMLILGALLLFAPQLLMFG